MAANDLSDKALAYNLFMLEFGKTQLKRGRVLSYDELRKQSLPLWNHISKQSRDDYKLQAIKKKDEILSEINNIHMLDARRAQKEREKFYAKNSLVKEHLQHKTAFSEEESNGDPFCQSLRNVIMEQVDFEKYLEHHVPQCKMLGKIPQLKRGMKLEVNCETFSIGKFIAKGSFGSIFIAEKDESKELLAVKQEKPANLWEYYICMELGDRLKSNDLEHMLPAFMQINYAIIGNNASVFFTEFSPFGTIIDVCNKIKKETGRHMDEYIGIVLTTQLLSIIDFLHACHIIHADIKPDNFLLLSKVELGSKVPALKLIDFGAAIDMEVYSKTDQFKYVVKTEYFTCCEMLEKKPWTYQTDLFGLAGTAHVILFGKYMEVEKKIGKWDITSRYPRYLKKYLWSVFFSTLLNVPDSFSMPNLQELKEMLLNAIACRTNVADKLNEFNRALLR